MFGHIGLLLWSGTLGYCSDSSFPAGAYRYAKLPGFPNGCTGTLQSTLAGSTSTPLDWMIPLDNFDTIATSMQSVLRIMMLNEWHPLLFKTMDSSRLFHQPILNNSIASFIYFFVLIVISVLVSNLFVAVVWYHYTLATLIGSGRNVLGIRQALWLIYEVK
jgi:hypothetical protein